MKKFIYLLAFLLALVNFSCASLFSTEGVCNCNCAACINCNNKHHVPLTAEQIAMQDSLKALQEKRKAELDSLLNMDYSLVHYEVAPPEPYKWEPDEVISTPLEELVPLFRTSQSSAGSTEYLIKDINTNYKENDCYFYFNTKDGVPEPLRFVVHYFADDPIYFDKLRFTIDDFKYEYVPTDIKRSNDGKFYAEYFDNAMSESSRDVVAALARCNYANMLMVNEKGVSHRIYFSEKQLKRFRETYKLYRKMGGEL